MGTIQSDPELIEEYASHYADPSDGKALRELLSHIDTIPTLSGEDVKRVLSEASQISLHSPVILLSEQWDELERYIQLAGSEWEQGVLPQRGLIQLWACIQRSLVYVQLIESNLCSLEEQLCETISLPPVAAFPEYWMSGSQEERV